MIFIDTDIFVIDELFPEDPRYKANKDFLNLKEERCTSIYNVLELCGLASFSLSTVELRSLFTNFHRHYNLEIAYPKIIYLSPEEMLSSFISRVFEKYA